MSDELQRLMCSSVFTAWYNHVSIDIIDAVHSALPSHGTLDIVEITEVVFFNLVKKKNS
jgi:uncharacterized protein (DUF2267 family)